MKDTIRKIRETKIFYVIWPYSIYSIELDMKVDYRHFVAVRPDDRYSWNFLRGLSSDTIVLAPLGVSNRELEDLLKERGFKIIYGINECARHVEKELQSK